MGVLELIQQKSFIGPEFLTWIWFRAETDGRVDLGDGAPLEIEMLGPITLEAAYGDARAGTLKGDSPTTSPEARTALIEGKKLRRARMKWTRDGAEWTFAIDAETFQLSGLAVPSPGRLPFAEAMTLRLEMLNDFESVFTRAFEQFMELRLDPALWQPELQSVQNWVRNK